MGDKVRELELKLAAVTVAPSVRRVNGKLVRVKSYMRKVSDAFHNSDADMGLDKRRRICKQEAKSGPLSAYGFVYKDGKLRQSRGVTVTPETDGFRVGIDNQPSIDCVAPNRDKMRAVAKSAYLALGGMKGAEIAKKLNEAHETLMALEVQPWFHTVAHTIGEHLPLSRDGD